MKGHNAMQKELTGRAMSIAAGRAVKPKKRLKPVRSQAPKARRRKLPEMGNPRQMAPHFEQYAK